MASPAQRRHHRCMPPTHHLDTTSLVHASPNRHGRSLGAPAAARAAVAVAVLLLLALALAPSAGASVYWGNGIGSGSDNVGTTLGRVNDDGTAVNQTFIGGA